MNSRSLVRRLHARALRGSVAVGVAMVAALGVSVLPAQAQATLDPFARVWTSPENRASLYFFGSTLDDYAGAQDTILSGWGGPDMEFDAYCINIQQNILHAPYPVNIRSTDDFNLGSPGIPQGGAAAWLYNHYVDIAFLDNRESAALQLSIWEAIYDWDGINFVGGTNSSVDLSTGNFRYLGNPAVPGPGIDPVVTADITARANTMLTTWQGQTDTATWYQGIGNPQPQDLIGRTPRIPEPGTLALGLLGAGCWVLGKRRRVR